MRRMGGWGWGGEGGGGVASNMGVIEVQKFNITKN